MRTSLFILLLVYFLPVGSKAQLDTLVIAQWTTFDFPLETEDLLRSDKLRKLTVDETYLLPYSTRTSPTKKTQRFLSKRLKLLNEKLPQIKVLYILNPTTQNGLQDSAQSIKYDTTVCPIYKLNFKKMMSLKTVHLAGDDTDDIIQMPAAFYQTPVTTVHLYNMHFSAILKQNLQRKKGSINVFVYDAWEGWDQLKKVFGM